MRSWLLAGFLEKLHEANLSTDLEASRFPPALPAPGQQCDHALCAKEPKWYSNTVSAVMVPPNINGAEVIDVAFRRCNRR